MVNAPETFIFFQVPSTAATEAFSFHEAAANPHIWLRTPEQIKEYADNGELFGVRRQSTGGMVALCYAVLDEHTDEWEVGGLTVAQSAQNFGIATLLMRFAVAHIIATQRPWSYGQEVITMAHEANDEPRKIFARLGFEQRDRVLAPPSAPASMKRNAAGEVWGDKFLLPHNAIHQLLASFKQDPKSMLRSDAVPQFIPPAAIIAIIDSLREAAAETSDEEDSSTHV